jgi:hypothetical protein
MEAATPGKEHEVLKQFEGAWNAACTFWMQPDQPPMTSKGVMVNSWALGGRFLKHDYKGEFMQGQSFEGVGYWGFNKGSGRYESVWLDTASTMMMVDLDGHFDDAGRKFEAIGTITDPMSGNPMKKKTTIEVQARDRHTMTMYFEQPGGGWHKCMEIVYTKKR